MEAEQDEGCTVKTRLFEDIGEGGGGVIETGQWPQECLMRIQDMVPQARKHLQLLRSCKLVCL